MPPPQTPDPPSFNPGATLDVVSLFAIIISGMWNPFLGYGKGTNAYRWIGPCALIGILCYGEMARCPLMLPFAQCWCGAVVLQCFLQDKRAPSIYLGYPFACHLPFVRSEAAGRVIEPFFVAGLGFAVAPVNEEFAVFCFAGGAALLIKEVISRAVVDTKIRAMEDAMAEQRYIAEAYRERSRR